MVSRSNGRVLKKKKNPEKKKHTRPGLVFEMHHFSIPASYKPSLLNSGQQKFKKFSPAKLGTDKI